MIKSEHGIYQISGLYHQPENTIDVMFMGTSHVHTNVNTGDLYEDYGIAAYDYSGAEQPLWMTYYYVVEQYKYQNPELIVLDLYAPARFKEDYQYTWISENIYGMKFSINKLKMLAVSVERDRILDYFPSYRIYHDRYDNLNEEDFQYFFWDRDDIRMFKGYTPQFKTNEQDEPNIETDVAAGLTEKSEKYLRKIIALTREHGTELAFVVAPYVITEEDKETYNQIEKIAEEEGIFFYDFNEVYEEMGLDFITDMADESHLNFEGSCKYTHYLATKLHENFDLPDRRGAEGYESWQDDAEILELLERGSQTQ